MTTALCWRMPRLERVFDGGARPVAALPACGVFQVSDIRRLMRCKPHISTFIQDRLTEVSEAYLGSDAQVVARSPCPEAAAY